MKKFLLITFLFLITRITIAQDTFSIVAVDSVTGEVGSAGASCVDLFSFPGITNDFLGELFPGVGAINTQAAYDVDNQTNARLRMNAGDSPTQIINFMIANDINNDPTIRQYGIVRLMGGSPKTAGYTGVNCMTYRNHIAGKNYCIQGNILLGPRILDSMEARFKRAQGDLACRLMAALQGANVIGADTRCAANQSSTLFAFLKVSKPSDVFGSPSFIVSVKTHNGAKIEPIDTLQILFSRMHSCSTGINSPGSTIQPLAFYPNPVTNALIIETFKSLNQTLEIRDITGRIILKSQLSEKLIVDMHDWKKGIYVLVVDDGISLTMRKVVKL